MTKSKHTRLVKKYLKNVKKFEESVKEMRISMAKCRSLRKYIRELKDERAGVSKEYKDYIRAEYQREVKKATALNAEANALSKVLKDLVADLQKDTRFEKVNQNDYVLNNNLLNEANSELTFM